jgi:hypothetical protein
MKISKIAQKGQKTLSETKQPLDKSIFEEKL